MTKWHAIAIVGIWIGAGAGMVASDAMGGFVAIFAVVATIVVLVKE